MPGLRFARHGSLRAEGHGGAPAAKLGGRRPWPSGAAPETNVYHYSAAMSSCSRRRDWPAAMSLLAELPQRRLAADLVVSNAGVNALARGGWAPALRLLRSLESVRRDAISFLERI